MWHVVDWNANGTHLAMFRRLDEGGGYLLAAYNLAVMLALGAFLGLLMHRVGMMMSRGRNGGGDQSDS